MTSMRSNIILLLAAVMIVAAPIILSLPGDYGGTDDLAAEAVEDTGYEPWFETLWSPSENVEGLIFNLQVALGAGLLGFVLGRVSARREGKRR